MRKKHGEKVTLSSIFENNGTDKAPTRGDVPATNHFHFDDPGVVV